MKVKSVVAVLLAFGMGITLLSGCSSKKPESIQIGYETLNGEVVILETATQETEENVPTEQTDVSSGTTEEEQAGANTEETAPAEESETTSNNEEDSTTSETEPTMCYDNPVSIPKNSVVQLTATMQPDNSKAEITWSSDNESLASVDETGKLTLYNEEGAATITAKTNTGLEAILTVDITKTKEEQANEEIAKALAEIANSSMTEEEAQAMAAELQSKYNALPESQKQAIAPSVDQLKTATQQKSNPTASSGNQNKNNNTSSGTASNNNSGKNTGGGSSGGSSGGNTGGGSSGGGSNPTPSPSPSPSPAPQPAEKYYPTMTPAEMESYAKSYAESIGLIYDPNASKDTWSWSAPSTTVPGESVDSVKDLIASKIDSAKSHGAKYVRCYAEPTGVTDSAGNSQYRIYILMG